MGRTHLLAGACVALTVSAYLGCAGKPRAAGDRGGAAPAAVQNHASQPQAAEGATGATRPPATDVGEVAPASIAQHAEAYAQNLETMLARRAATRQPPAHGAATPPGAPAPAAPDNGADPQRAASGANAAMEVAPERGPAHDAERDLSREPTPGPAEAANVSPAGERPAVVPPAPATQATQASTTQPRPKVTVPPVSRSSPAPRAPSPAPTQASATFGRPGDDALSRLESRARDYPQDAAAQLDYQLLQFLREESVPDLAPLAPLAAEDRELLTALLDGLSNFRNGLRAESNMLQSRKVAPLLEMGDRLRSQGELTLPVAALCAKVERFGVYEPMEPAQFKAGVPNEAILYCEVANFSSQLGADRMWETRLRHESVLYSETGLAVWQDKADDVTDSSRNRRHDFYVVERLRVPAMPVGRYLLKVTVTDLQVNRVAEVTVPIQVVAQ